MLAAANSPEPPAGLTELLVAEIDTGKISVNAGPTGMPTNPPAAPFEAVPLMMNKEDVIATSHKELARAYLPGLRSP